MSEDFIYKDYIPANARILIDYTTKERVRFSYPLKYTYEKAVWKWGYFSFLGFWIQIHFLVLVYISTFVLLVFGPLLLFLFFLTLLFPSTTTTITEYNFLFFIKQIGWIAAFLLYFLGIPAIVNWWLSKNKEKYSNIIPEMNYWISMRTGGLKEKIFEIKDIDDNKVVIHNFSNVCLNYKCEGDFNNCLDKIEILEIPFNYIKKEGLLFRKTKKEVNEFEFRAVFYFSRKPTDGSMLVEFI